MFKYINWICCCLLFFSFTLSGQVAINISNTQPDASAILDVQSTNKGFLIPHLSTTKIDTILSPAEGLLVYNTDSSSFFFFNNSEWLKVGSTSPSNKRSILIPATSIDDSALFENSISRGQIGFTSTIDIPNGVRTNILINIPIPEDFVSGFATVKLLYTSEETTGNFQVNCSTRSYPEGVSLSLAPGGGGAVFPAASSSGQLTETTLQFGNGANPNNEKEYIILGFRRQGQGAQDTVEGDLRIVGFVLEYIAN